MTATNAKPLVRGVAKTKVTYQQRTALFGLIKWWVEVKAEVYAKALHIYTPEEFGEVIINGEHYEKRN